MRFIKLFVLASILMPFSKITAHAATVDNLEVDRPGQGIGFNQSIDVSRYGTIGAQAVYSDGTPSSHTINTGVKRSATITPVLNSTDLIGAQASVTVSVRSTQAVSGDQVIIGGITFCEGSTVGKWKSDTSTTTAATRLKDLIDAHPDYVATSAGSTVTVKYVSYGTAGNGIPVTTSDSTNLVISAATMASGIARPTVIMNGVTLTEGVDFNANSSSLTVTNNLVTAINANATLNLQVIASSAYPSAVTTITALYPGLNSDYYLITSTAGLANSGFAVGGASDLDIATDIFSKIAHGFTTGIQVILNAPPTSVTAPTGLTNGTTYYVIKLNEDRYKLATTSTTAVAGTAINITALTSTNNAEIIKPLALAVGANNGFKWQASNDNSNFSDLSVSSVTYSAAGNTLWDFGTFAYKYLRLVFVQPTSGGITLRVRLFGKEK